MKNHRTSVFTPQTYAILPPPRCQNPYVAATRNGSQGWARFRIIHEAHQIITL
jgi:hypothetical protein